MSLGRNGNIEEVDLDIKPNKEPYKIKEIKRDMGEVNLVALIVDPGEPREFLRKDGGKGQVRTVLLGDETGKISLTLWNEQAMMPLEKGETIEVLNGSSRERYGSVEIQTGNYTRCSKEQPACELKELITPIADLKQGMLCSISGFVTGLGEVREFQRDDGKMGSVANIYISDDTGRIKVALWGDHVELLKGPRSGLQSGAYRCFSQERLERRIGALLRMAHHDYFRTARAIKLRKRC